MNSITKNALGVAIIIGILLFAIVALQYVDSYSKSIEPSSFRSFSVSGEGKSVAIPDIAEFSFSVITQGGTDIETLERENVEKTNAAIDFVKANGVEDKDIKTQNFRLEPRYQHFSCPRSFFEEAKPCPPSEIVGYTVAQSVLVKVRDFGTIGKILSGVVQEGANSVSQLAFTLDDRDAKETEARTEAIKKAQEKARAIAEAGGFKIGRLLSIQEGGSPVFPPYAYIESLDRGTGGGLSAPVPSIEPGSQEVKVNVVLRYEID